MEKCPSESTTPAESFLHKIGDNATSSIKEEGEQLQTASGNRYNDMGNGECSGNETHLSSGQILEKIVVPTAESNEIKTNHSPEPKESHSKETENEEFRRNLTNDGPGLIPEQSSVSILGNMDVTNSHLRESRESRCKNTENDECSENLTNFGNKLILECKSFSIPQNTESLSNHSLEPEGTTNIMSTLNASGLRPDQESTTINYQINGNLQNTCLQMSSRRHSATQMDINETASKTRGDQRINSGERMIKEVHNQNVDPLKIPHTVGAPLTHVIICGLQGAGKSSLRQLLETPPKNIQQSSQQHFNFKETSPPCIVKTLNQLQREFKENSTTTGYVVIMVIRKGRITDDIKNITKNELKYLSDEKNPILLCVSGCDTDDDLNWWSREENWREYRKYRFYLEDPTRVLCGCTIMLNEVKEDLRKDFQMRREKLRVALSFKIKEVAQPLKSPNEKSKCIIQ